MKPALIEWRCRGVLRTQSGEVTPLGDQPALVMNVESCCAEHAARQYAMLAHHVVALTEPVVWCDLSAYPRDPAAKREGGCFHVEVRLVYSTQATRTDRRGEVLDA